jgi:two-component system, NtrC family, response regulator PilR
VTLPTELIADDDRSIRTVLTQALGRSGYQVRCTGNAATLWRWVEEGEGDLVITDVVMPDENGLELIPRIKRIRPDLRIVVMSAQSTLMTAVKAAQRGAFEYLPKPFDLQELLNVVGRALAAPAEPALRAPEPRDAEERLPLIGRSPAMQEIYRTIARLTTTDLTVMINGESGTGKELVARAVHACSHRAAGPFVAVNCGAIPENLLEAEFFGARKGAYTGSTQDRQGYFQAAKGGTLFLDEIGDLPLAMQSKLLRAIQERSVRPLGSPQEDTVDVRIVSATHKDLGAQVQASAFRQDLYYRLNVIEIGVPPLRERREDLPALCQALLSRICKESGLAVPELTGAVMEQLRSHPFDGNVRELENILHRAVALGEGNDLHFEAPPQDFVAVPENLQEFLDQQEKNILSKVLQETGFNRTAAASKLGLSLRQIRYRIARLNIETPGGDDASDEPA